jgi:hypothetical protein
VYVTRPGTLDLAPHAVIANDSTWSQLSHLLGHDIRYDMDRNLVAKPRKPHNLSLSWLRFGLVLGTRGLPYKLDYK